MEGPVDKILQAREDGYRSGIQGIDPRCNPYDKLTKEWKAWNTFHTYGVELITSIGHDERCRLRSVYK